MATQNNYATAAKLEDSMLGKFFIDQLKDIYWAEQHLVKKLPDMIDAATSDKLKEAIGSHLEQTKQHVSRLENIFRMIGEESKAQKCKAMSGISDEGDDIIDETEEGTATRDSGVIFAAQKVEHYEIATYGSLISVARCLDYSDVAEILEQTLAEEKKADQTLTSLSDTINKDACREMNDD